jgi:hypothetical protein
MSQISVDSVIPQSGTTITVGASGDTVNLGSGASTNGFLPSAIAVSGTDFQFNSGFGSTATSYGCRAWVNFNGTGTVAIRDSGNVSSITDNTTGDYTVNFTTAMPDTNYCAVGTTIGSTDVSYATNLNSSGSALSASGVTVEVRNTVSDSVIDHNCINVAIFR